MKALIFFITVLLLSINVLHPKKYLIEVADEVEHPEDDDDTATEESKKTDTQFNTKIYFFVLNITLSFNL